MADPVSAYLANQYNDSIAASGKHIFIGTSRGGGYESSTILSITGKGDKVLANVLLSAEEAKTLAHILLSAVRFAQSPVVE